MSDEKLFKQIFNNGYQTLIKQRIKGDGFKSIKDVKVYDKKVKSKWFIFPITKEVKVIKFIVDESLFVMESLADDLRIEDYRLQEYQLDDSELEIEYI